MSLLEHLRVGSLNGLGLKSEAEIAHFSQLKDKVLANDDINDCPKEIRELLCTDSLYQ